MPLKHLCHVSRCALHGLDQPHKLVEQTIPPKVSHPWASTAHSNPGPQPGWASLPEGGGRNAGTGGYTKPPRHLAISEI